MQSILPGFRSLDCEKPIWDQFFQVFSLVLVGTREADGRVDLAPKHMAMPLSWQNYFGFVCAPTHGTYQNIKRDGCFTVSYPRPDQVVLSSLAASPRDESDIKANIHAMPMLPATEIQGEFLDGCYLYLECKLTKFVDDLGENSLIIGEVVAAHADEHLLVRDERETREEIGRHPLLAYLHPMRFASIKESHQFPLPMGFKK